MVSCLGNSGRNVRMSRSFTLDILQSRLLLNPSERKATYHLVTTAGNGLIYVYFHVCMQKIDTDCTAICLSWTRAYACSLYIIYVGVLYAYYVKYNISLSRKQLIRIKVRLMNKDIMANPNPIFINGTSISWCQYSLYSRR